MIVKTNLSLKMFRSYQLKITKSLLTIFKERKKATIIPQFSDYHFVIYSRCPDYPLLHVAPLDEVESQHQPFPLDDIQFVDDDKDDSEINTPSADVYSGSGLNLSSSLQPYPGTG